jgi:hypothetical protein
MKSMAQDVRLYIKHRVIRLLDAKWPRKLINAALNLSPRSIERIVSRYYLDNRKIVADQRIHSGRKSGFTTGQKSIMVDQEEL